MKRIVVGLLLASFLLLTGCANWGKYQVPKEQYQAQVQVLGVLPLLVDRNAPLEYPQKDLLYDLLSRSAGNKHHELIPRLKAKKGYFDVRALPGNEQLVGMSVLAAPLATDKFGRPQGYSFNSQAVAEIARRNAVEALLVVVFSGAQIEETRRSRSLLESLKTRYNDVVAMAAVVSRDGQVLWQMAGSDNYQALPLQYADFDEAFYNKTDQVHLKFITLAGVERILDEAPGKDGKVKLPPLYDALFDRITKGISPGILDSLR